MSIDQSSGFTRIATIDEIHRPFEVFLEQRGGPGPIAGDFSPLDAYLLQLVVEFCPAPVTVVDLACRATRCCSTFICLRSKNVARVIAGVDSSGDPGVTSAVIDLLREMVEPGDRGTGPALVVDESARPWERLPLGDGLPGTLSLFLIDPATVSGGLIETLQSIIAAFPRSLVLVVSVGRVGESETVTSLIQACHGSSPLKLWLLRDLSGALLESRLALVAARELSLVPPMILRLEQLFATNFDFLQLLHGCAMYAIERGLASRMEEELQQLKSQAMESERENVRLQARLEELQQLKSQAMESERENVRLQARLESVVREKVQAEEHFAEVQGLLHRECTRPVGKAIVLQSGRRLVRLVRRNRPLLVPAGSFRERVAREFMRVQRIARGKVC